MAIGIRMETDNQMIWQLKLRYAVSSQLEI